MDTWERVLDLIDTKQSNKRRKTKHDFTYSGLVRCGRCGYKLVGDMKKGRYIYYCIPSAPGKPRCPGPYATEERLDQAFSAALSALRLDDELFEWLRQAMRESHADEEKFHAESVARLRAEHDRLGKRIHALYADKARQPDQRGTVRRPSAEWTARQHDVRRDLDAHERANTAYLDARVRIIEL